MGWPEAFGPNLYFKEMGWGVGRFIRSEIIGLDFVDAEDSFSSFKPSNQLDSEISELLRMKWGSTF